MRCEVEFGKRTRYCGVCKKKIEPKKEAHLCVYTYFKNKRQICRICLNNFADEANHKLPRRHNEDKKTS